MNEEFNIRYEDGTYYWSGGLNGDCEFTPNKMEKAFIVEAEDYGWGMEEYLGAIAQDGELDYNLRAEAAFEWFQKGYELR